MLTCCWYFRNPANHLGCTLPETNIAPEHLEDDFPDEKAYFQGAMLVSGQVHPRWLTFNSNSTIVTVKDPSTILSLALTGIDTLKGQKHVDFSARECRPLFLP